jgi:hypothetical protein
MRLRELQRSFQNRVLRHRHGIEAQLDGVDAEDFDSRLNAYVGGYRTRLIEALASTYPVLKATLGEDEFDREMRLYIDSTDSCHFSVRPYGADMAQRLLGHSSGVSQAAFAELAAWEWLLADVFDSPDDEALDVRELAALAPPLWPTLTFSLRASVRFFDSQTNAVECWRAANGLCEKPAALGQALPTRWLVWRRGITTLFRSLSSVEAALLDQVRDGASFGLMCEQMAGQVGETESPLRTATQLRGWLAEELIKDYTCAGSLHAVESQ